jgi:NitT/TauT family transport system permease protein
MESASLPTQDLGRRRRATSVLTSDVVLGALGILSFAALWWYGHQKTTFVPSFGEVLDAVPSFLTEEAIWPDIFASTTRVVGALALACVVGFLAALLMARGRFWGLVTARYVDLALGLPSTIAALLALFIFKRSEVGVFVVVAIATFPFIALTLRQGFLSANKQLDDMADVYRFRPLMRVRNVFLPHLVPYSLAAIRNEYAHAWRVVVLAELFAVNSGIGWRFAQAFDRFQLVEVALWLLTFMVVLLGSEYLILRPVEKWALRWRGDA